MERQPQNPEIRINPENFHQCLYAIGTEISCTGPFIVKMNILQ